MRISNRYGRVAAAGALAVAVSRAVTGVGAQEQPPAAPPAATRPAAAGPASNPTTGPAPISLDFRNAPLDAVLEHLSEAAGFAVVKDGAVDGRVTVVSRQPVSPDEAVTLLNAVLKSNGFAAVRNGRVLRVSARDVAKKQNLPVRFGADPADVPATDELVTQVIPVGSVDAVKLRQDLAPILGTEADVAANGGSNALIVTDTSANVRRVVQIIAALDRHEPGSIELRRYPLKHADAAAAVKLILGLLKPPDQQVPKAPDPNRTPFDQALRGRVAAVADDRTNTLFVTAPAATLGVVDGIVKDLEANPTAAAEIKIFSLKFADAASAAKLIAGVFRPDDAPRRGSDGEVRPRDPAEQALRARVVAQADDRTNTLVVTAPGATMKVVEEILTKLDADPSSTSEIKVFPLNYADAASAAKLIVAVFRPPEGQTAAAEAPRRYGPAAETPVTAKVIAAADDRTNSVVINAPPETIKAIEKVLQVLDANPAASATVKSFPLKHADAASAVSLLNTLFGQTPTLASTAAAAAAAATSVVPAASGRARLTAAYDSRTNTVIVQAPAELITAAEAVIRDLEANPATDETLFIYRLRNGQAARMEQVLNVLFGNVQPGQGQNGRLGANDLLGGGRTGTTASRLGTGTGRSRSSRGGTTFGNDGLDARALGLDGRGNRGQLAAQQQLSQASSRVVTELTGQVLVVADEDTNSLLVTTGTKYLDQVKQVIAELDRPVPQVLIKVLVAEVTHDDGVDFGVDFSILNQRPSGLGQTGGTSFGLSGADAATGGLVVQLLESRVNATLRALATKGKLEVLSRPYILASDNQLASITVGQEVPFITNTRITDNGQQINTIEYQDVGIILSVTPHINPDGLVIMDVIPEISQLTSSTVPISAGVTAPVIAKRSATSRVGIRTGNTIVIGGLMEDRKTVTVLKVPLLGDIPLIGPLFARTRMDKTKTELLIFLTPVVATQPDALVPMTGDEAAGTALVPNAISPGMFDRHLDGMQRGSGATTQPAPGAPTTLPQTQGLELPIRPQHVGPVTPATQPAGGGR